MPSFLFRKIRDINLSMEMGRIPYIAGLLDGEGGFSIVRARTKRVYFHPHITLQHTDEETVRRFSKWCGVDYRTRLLESRRKSYYAGINTREDLRWLLEKLQPWLITKEKHAQLMLEFLSRTEDREIYRNTPQLKTEKKDIQSDLIDIYVNLRKLNTKDPYARHIDYEELRHRLKESLREDTKFKGD